MTTTTWQVELFYLEQGDTATVSSILPRKAIGGSFIGAVDTKRQ